MTKIYKSKYHFMQWSPDLWLHETQYLSITETSLFADLCNHEWQWQRMNRVLSKNMLEDIKKNKFKNINFDKVFNKLLDRGLVKKGYDGSGKLFYSTSMCANARDLIINRKKNNPKADGIETITSNSAGIAPPITNEINNLPSPKQLDNINKQTRFKNNTTTDMKKYSQEDIDQHERIEKSKIALFGKHNS